jgi:hypothetical protein
VFFYRFTFVSKIIIAENAPRILNKNPRKSESAGVFKYILKLSMYNWLHSSLERLPARDVEKSFIGFISKSEKSS